MKTRMHIHIKTEEYIWQSAMEFLIESFKVHQNEKTLLLLSGGSAVKLYPAVAEFIKTSDLDLGYLAIGQVDERFIARISYDSISGPAARVSQSLDTSRFGTPRSRHPFKYESARNSCEDMNSYQIERTGLWEACKMKNIPYYLISQKGTLTDAADQNDKQMEQLFKDYIYKIAVLGIGEDCHAAGLLPGYKSAWDKKRFSVGYKNNGRFPKRITLTPNSLEQLDEAIVIAVGEKKKEAIKDAINPLNINNMGKYPAAVLQKIKKVDLFTDIRL